MRTVRVQGLLEPDGIRIQSDDVHCEELHGRLFEWDHVILRFSEPVARLLDHDGSRLCVQAGRPILVTKLHDYREALRTQRDWIKHMWSASERELFVQAQPERRWPMPVLYLGAACVLAVPAYYLGSAIQAWFQIRAQGAYASALALTTAGLLAVVCLIVALFMYVNLKAKHLWRVDVCTANSRGLTLHWRGGDQSRHAWSEVVNLRTVIHSHVRLADGRFTTLRPSMAGYVVLRSYEALHDPNATRRRTRRMYCWVGGLLAAPAVLMPPVVWLVAQSSGLSNPIARGARAGLFMGMMTVFFVVMAFLQVKAKRWAEARTRRDKQQPS